MMLNPHIDSRARRAMLVAAGMVACLFAISPDVLARGGQGEERAPKPNPTSTEKPSEGSEPDGKKEAQKAPEGSEQGAEKESEERVSKERLEEIRSTFHLEEGAFETIGASRRNRAALQERSRSLAERAEQIASRAREIRAVADSLGEQLENPALPESAITPLRFESARGTAKSHVRQAQSVALSATNSVFADALDDLEKHASQLEEREESQAKQDSEERERVAEAMQAEQKALAELERAKKAEKLERDREIKKLISRRSKVLGKTASVAREQSKQIQKLGNQRGEASETFARRQEEIDGAIESFDEEVEEEEAREEVDPVFENIRTYRDEARRDYRAAVDDLRAAMAQASTARRQVGNAEENLDEVKDRNERLSDTDLARHKTAVAEAELKFRRRLREKADDVVSAREKALELHAERIHYYSDALERVLPSISEQKRADYFSVWKNENWRNVEASFHEATRYMSNMLRLRLEQIQSLPSRVYSAELWGWLFGFLWRVLLIPLGLYLLRNYSRAAIHRLMDYLLRRRFFRKRATGTIKLGELLRSIVWPLTLFFTTLIAVGYVARTFPEAKALEWAIDVVFLYWIVMAFVKVMVLPRAFREKQDARTPSPDLGRLSDGSRLSGRDVVDVFEFELEQAEKLVRTVRHVLIFVLAAWLVPQLFAQVFGHTVLWWLVQSAFKWAVIGIVYFELSNWRDEVASLFRRLAGSRIPRIADFVEQHKDRIYGVLIIAFASVYVLIVEAGQLARRYLVETETAKRIGNFVFRKKIEMKQKERDEEPQEEQTRDGEIPDDYLELFQDRPLYDEAFLVKRPDVMTKLSEIWESWRESPRQGSVAVTGEQGSGKSTLLNQFYRSLNDREEQHPVIYAALTDKIGSPDTLIGYLADLFDLDTVPQTRDELVAEIKRQPSTVVMIDDCHNLFFRKIEGFEALALFLDIVNLTDHLHFWLLTFNKYGWKYLQRVQERKHFFGSTIAMPAWSADELQLLIDRRNEMVSYNISFTDLVVTREDERQDYYEVVKTANGYFRLLQEFCEGNPRVAIDFWARNLSMDGDATLQVSLFRKPSLDDVSDLTDNHLFALTAIVQHGSLGPAEVADIINAEQGFCEMALNYFEEVDIATRSKGTGRFRLTPFYFRPVVDRLAKSNFLWS